MKPWMTGKNVATAVFLLLADWLVITAVWMKVRFGTIDMTTILFQLKVPMSGADPGNFYEIFILLLTVGTAMLLAEIGLLFLVRKWRANRLAKAKNAGVPGGILSWRRIIALGLMIAALCFVGYRLHIVRYVVNQFGNSPIYDDEYRYPENTAIAAPENKRNLIFIYMESMECTYADKEHGGTAATNMIPEMTELALNNVNFTPEGSTQLNGAVPVVGTTWTMASLVAQTSGVPLTIPIGENAMGKRAYKTFLPGVYSLGQVLRDNGYELSFLLGSEKEFSGADIFLSTHGDYKILDLNTYRNNGKLPKDYFVWWGFEDMKVYDFAKEELTALGAGDKPFAFTMMTMDTHFTNGLRCDLCPVTYPDQYSNVIACASKQLDSFLSWLSEQPYYENTTVVIVGDHPTMDTKYITSLAYAKDSYERKAYCAILNSAVSYELPYARQFTSMDMYPTTLAAMGFKISGDRLGIGVNLFSNEPTMLEKYGKKKLDDLLEERSDFYDTLIYGKEE
ncbi:MAG: sulfatase-like hydrolase/transferase [Lachnospiraceae bacterium]|nr:sulfatase-like hydrolase/transferase [Lachnospiraceae bacterium]